MLKLVHSQLVPILCRSFLSDFPDSIGNQRGWIPSGQLRIVLVARSAKKDPVTFALHGTNVIDSAPTSSLYVPSIFPAHPTSGLGSGAKRAGVFVRGTLRRFLTWTLSVWPPTQQTRNAV